MKPGEKLILLRNIYPGLSWDMIGDDYAGAFWPETNPIAKPTLEELDVLIAPQVALMEALAAGYHVMPEDIYLAVGQADIDAFAKLWAQLRAEIEMDAEETAVLEKILDKAGVAHLLTKGRLVQIFLGYGRHCKGLWDAATPAPQE